MDSRCFIREDDGGWCVGEDGEGGESVGVRITDSGKLRIDTYDYEGFAILSKGALPLLIEALRRLQATDGALERHDGTLAPPTF